MVLPGHISGGYLAAQAVLTFFQPGFEPWQVNTLLTLGALAGDLPDIDLIAFYLNRRPKGRHTVIDHREYITHTPIFWFVISTIPILLGNIYSSIFISYVGIILLMGTWSHLILDSIEYGIRWLWPFSNERYYIVNAMPLIHVSARPGTLRAHIQFIFGTYIKMWSFWFEILITIVALAIFIG